MTVSPMVVTPTSQRLLAVFAVVTAALGLPLVIAGSHGLITGFVLRDTAIVGGFVLAVASVVLAILGLVLARRRRVFVAALAITAAWIIVAIVVLRLLAG